MLGEIGKYRANHIITFKGNNIHTDKVPCPVSHVCMVDITEQCVCFLTAGTTSYIYFFLSYAPVKGYIMVD